MRHASAPADWVGLFVVGPQGMLSPQPGDRLTVDEVKEHQWVARALPAKYSYGDEIIDRTWESDDSLHVYHVKGLQTDEEITRVIRQASQPPPASEGREEREKKKREEGGPIVD